MKTQSADTSPEAERVQIALLRQASIARRIGLLRSLTSTALRLSRRATRRRHPTLDAANVAIAWAALQYGHEVIERLGVTPREGIMESADILAVLTPVVEAFERTGIPYRIGGSLASSAFGIARATADVDIVADLHPDQVSELAQHLEAAYDLDADAMQDAIRHGSSFNLIHLATMLKVDVFMPRRGPYEAEAARRVRQETLGETASARSFVMTGPEDTVLAKLERYRLGGETSERQWLDVLGVLKVQAGALDLPYVRLWVPELGVADLLGRALVEAGLAEG